jgi:UDP-N-acetylmuramate dehydrogenase
VDREALTQAVRGAVRFDEPLAKHTTLRVGGPADAWVEPADAEDLRALVAHCHRAGLRCRALGIGSNLVVRDGGVRGVVVSTRRLDRMERIGALGLRVEAGLGTARLLSATLDMELSGVEFLAGVPGTVGGGLVMNAGTYLGEFKDVTVRVATVDPRGEVVVRDAADCGFAYRASTLPRDEIVVWGELALRPRPRADMEREVRELRDRRRQREPRGLPNAGSFFKNPPGDHAGRLIEQAGLKGRTAGHAQISHAHANWLVNTGGATAADFLLLAGIAHDEVQRQFGVDLELEVKVVGEDGPAPGGET